MGSRKPVTALQAAVGGDVREVDAGGDGRPSAPTSFQAKRTRSLWASGPVGELEAVARELLLGGADHRVDAVGALAGHQRVEVGGVVGPGRRR